MLWLSFALSIDHEINTAFRARFLRDKGKERRDWYLSHRCEIQRDFALLSNKRTGATIDESLLWWPLQFASSFFRAVIFFEICYLLSNTQLRTMTKQSNILIKQKGSIILLLTYTNKQRDTLKRKIYYIRVY